MPTRDLTSTEALLKRLAWRAQIPHLILAVLTLIFVVGVMFLAFALLIRVRAAQLLEALRADPPRVVSIRLETRRIAPMGINAMSSVFAVIEFRSQSGSTQTLRLQGKAIDLAELVRGIEAVCPTVRIDDPREVRVLVV